MNNFEEDNSGEKKFEELGLKDWLVKQCAVVGINKPSPIQMNCIPKIIQGF